MRITLHAGSETICRLKTFQEAIMAVMTIKDRPLFKDEENALIFGKKLSFVSNGVRYFVTVEN